MVRYSLLRTALSIFAFACISLTQAGAENAAMRPDLDALCKKVFDIKYPDGRNITNCRLREPTEFQGRWCDVGDTRFDRDWNLVACHLERDHMVGELTVPAGSWVHFYPEGQPQSMELPGDLMIQGLLLKNGKKDWRQHLYEDGKLRKAYLARNEEIQGVPCVKASIRGTLSGRTYVRFHEDGKLEGCKLSAPMTIQGRDYKKGDRISFDREGELKSGYAPPEE